MVAVDLWGFVLRNISLVCNSQLPQAQESWLCATLTNSSLSNVVLKSAMMGVLAPQIQASVTMHQVSLSPTSTPSASCSAFVIALLIAKLCGKEDHHLLQ